MAVEIVEVIRRSEHGRTRPFICRGDDGHIYFVKGRGAGLRSLLCEWVAGHLGVSFGLPLAEFCVVHVDAALVEAGGTPELSQLGAGPAFGSRALPHVQELSWPHLDMIGWVEMRDLIVFDWWIRNGDRCYTKNGGNPNLLWDQETESLVVIDHNLAFDRDFSAQDFRDLHVFSNHWPDLVEQAEYQARLIELLPQYAVACETAPVEWWWQDDDIPSDFDREAVGAMLERCQGKDFWSLAP